MRIARAARKAFLQSAFHGELVGGVEGLKMVSRLGMARAVLATDVLTVKVAVEGDDYSLSSMGGVITVLKHLMATEFISCSVNVVPVVVFVMEPTNL